jgi:hypothetical protein
LIALDQVNTLDKANLIEQATLVNRLLATDVREQFLESNTYQNLLKYQGKFTLLYAERHISEQLNKFKEKLPINNETNLASYAALEQMYSEKLNSMKNEPSNGNYINIKQVSKQLVVVDNLIKEKISEQDMLLAERAKLLTARENSLSNYYKIENNITENLKKYKWAFNTSTNQSNDPYIAAIQELKEKFAEIRNKIKSGEITELDPIKKTLIESLNTLGDKLRDIQQRTLIGKIGLSSSKTADKTEEAIIELKRSPRI